MLRRSFVKFMGLFGGLLSTPALASSGPLPEPVKEPTLAEILALGNTAEGSDTHVCTECVSRDQMKEGPRGKHYFAVEEDELWGELECWFQGHMDAHDIAINDAKQRVLAGWKAKGSPVLSSGRSPMELLTRPVQLTLDYA